jgi:serine phosphatase RsbU (regulator of sigma subunit)
VASIAIPLTENDMGPFSGHPPDDRLLLAQGFLGIASLTALVLAAVITERRRAEEAAEYIAGTLQESLLPSGLPVIPGIETAVDFRAAGREHLVGGDFYDLFPGDDGSWTVVVGDVLGKGATAAATTGLARYTLRAAAVSESRPSRILGMLNDAIRRQSPDQSCTVACGRLDINGGEGARLTLALGGHPLPLMLRADGRVEPVGQPGTTLGVLPDPDLADRSADLAPGDALVLYTDGLTDAYAPGRIVKRASLVAALESCAGQSASEIASGIQQAALGRGHAEPRDDIVLLVLRVPERRQEAHRR